MIEPPKFLLAVLAVFLEANGQVYEETAVSGADTVPNRHARYCHVAVRKLRVSANLGRRQAVSRALVGGNILAVVIL